MSELITALTKEQEADIQPTINSWLEYAKTTNREEAKTVITEVYQKYTRTTPLIVFTTSPLTSQILSVIWEKFWSDFRNRLNSAVDMPNKGASLSDSLGASLSDSLSASLSANLSDSLGDSLSDSLSASLRDSLSANLSDSLGDSLSASLGDSLSASLSASLRDSLSASLRDSLSANLSASLGASLGASLRDSLSASLSKYLQTEWLCQRWWYGSVGIVDFCLRHLETKMDVSDANLWVRLGKYVGYFQPYANVVFVSDRPTELHWSEALTPKVLDYDHGASVEYSDGFKMYHLRGVRLSEENYNLITSGELTGSDITKLSSDGKLNADQAAVAWQFLGADNLLKGMNAQLIATGTKHHATIERLGEDLCSKKYKWAFRPETELYQVDNFMDTGQTEYCIKMWHPTIENKIYIEWVEPAIGKKKDADLAQAVAFNIEKKDYIKAYEA